MAENKVPELMLQAALKARRRIQVDMGKKPRTGKTSTLFTKAIAQKHA